MPRSRTTTPTVPPPPPGEIDPEVDDEVEKFNRDRQRIRLALEHLGGKRNGFADRVANVVFEVGVLFLFILRFVFKSIGDMLSLELGLLLVSVKILWMMRSQERYQHFLFWMLHSIEFRQNEILERLSEERLARERGVAASAEGVEKQGGPAESPASSAP